MSISPRPGNITIVSTPTPKILDGLIRMSVSPDQIDLQTEAGESIALRARPLAGQDPLLTPQEAEIQNTLDSLMQNRWDRSAPEHGLPLPWRASFLAHLNRRIAAACVKHLLHHGGLQIQSVLRDGKRLHGRLWDNALLGGLQLNFGLSTFKFIRGLSTELPHLLHGSHTRKHKHRTKRWIDVENAQIGDWILFAMVQPALTQLSEPWHDQVMNMLRKASPLVTLHMLQGKSSRALYHGPALRVLECSGRWRLQSWRHVIDSALSPRHLNHPKLDQKISHSLAIIIPALTDHLAKLDNKRQTHLAWPLMILLSELPERAALWSPDIHREATQSIGNLLNTGTLLTRLREQLGQQRYGDDRYAEAQLYMSAYDQYFAPHADEIVRHSRRLRRVLG